MYSYIILKCFNDIFIVNFEGTKKKKLKPNKTFVRRDTCIKYEYTHQIIFTLGIW